MAQLTVFDFHSGSSFLHRLDIRFKLLILIGVNLSVALASQSGLAGLSTVLILTLWWLRISVRRLLSEIRLFLLLLVLIFSARAFSTPGSPLIPSWTASLTTEGLQAGGLICWRLSLIVMLGLLFIYTSKPLEVKAAIQWYFRPIPGVSGQRIALMISLMIRFIPMILELSGEISEAQRSRAIESRKNPLFRMKVFVLPLLEGVFKKADEMVDSMEARCFSENRTDPELLCQRSDWILLALSGVSCLGMIIV
ncbi:MAG: energy-coupling factor transporter transmembrane protein EcfT [Deltaproteobacteria bacterium]|jgi:energy-coupling factor transporter transmembrane protein EcfT|nr:energy-coupling factor transporter transmembrane protein EcfT [Deltaproteobacteria bacterium]MBT4091174.1 energy-coupling factor transporter transmembrane protein EcfT [Deltaproteobacteria bacterium]MBT4267032.1 energy-coupling factor transporter transmembrane protein EcfT [Deltaproteobacteria bacterium]MBT4641915.1 energy-coupling factor transporter transmembrane protein EcfT [Deltaproteobacteria bacterium]MBT6505109.1 energy-coupling factor transporter transmembrane protein EcfT [Deltaprot